MAIRKMKEVSVLLTVQIDIVSKPHQTPVIIPPNVARAANFFHTNGGFLHGKPKIIAENAAKTEIEGNFWMIYRKSSVDCRNFPWLARTFNRSHHEIENDSRVWAQIDTLINATLLSSSESHQ